MNRNVIGDFRVNRGKVGGPFEGKPLILVHHCGAKSGTERITPLVPYLDGQHIYVFASKAGAETNPDWYHNLVANPNTTVEVGTDEGTETIPVTARVLNGSERDNIYAQQSAVEPQFADYQRNTDRLIPVIELQRASS
ncbi:nitroreductase/quinone reductase family protein [Mycobacterium sp.]|uniref:nitroreductase/quinone reductase family protein n=1 Tax=Mycobacterium sp. TaxID=1785 RepID=UPI003D0CD9B2